MAEGWFELRSLTISPTVFPVGTQSGMRYQDSWVVGSGRIIWLHFSSIEPHPKSCVYLSISGQTCPHTSSPGTFGKDESSFSDWLLSDAEREKLERGSWVWRTHLHTGQSCELVPDWPIFQVYPDLQEMLWARTSLRTNQKLFEDWPKKIWIYR